MARRPYSGKLVSPFGPRKSPGGIGSTNHLGEDGIGGPNVAPEAGVLTEWRRVGGWGNRAVIVGESGAVHYLAHNADRGQLAPLGPVYEGQPIGVQGMTGTATGVHVHWEVRLKGVPVNPSVWLAEQHQTAATTIKEIVEELKHMATGVIITPDANDRDRSGAIIDTTSGFVSTFGDFPVSYANDIAEGLGAKKAITVSRQHYNKLVKDLSK